MVMKICWPNSLLTFIFDAPWHNILYVSWFWRTTGQNIVYVSLFLMPQGDSDPKSILIPAEPRQFSPSLLVLCFSRSERGLRVLFVLPGLCPCTGDMS